MKNRPSQGAEYARSPRCRTTETRRRGASAPPAGDGRETPDRTPPERIKVWRVPEFDGIELLRADYRTQTFTRHSHDCFAVGVIEDGALGFQYRGEHLVAPAGAVNLAFPGEPHTGHAAHQSGWRYRMLYLAPAILEEIASDIADRTRPLPFFPQGVIQDPALAREILDLHRIMEQPDAGRLLRETRLCQTLSALVRRYAAAPPTMKSVGPEHRTVARVKDYLDAHADRNVSLKDLSRIAERSPFHLLRIFRRATGLPPHAYQTQIRVNQAKRLLEQNHPLVDVALLTGFVDQSHFTRCFKRIVGLTPGQYRNSIQDAPREDR